MTFSTSPTISGSSADVGSSNRMTSGFIDRVRAIATRCFCPPDSCRGLAATYGFMPTRVRYSIATCLASTLLRCMTRTCPIMQFLSADMLLKRLNCWNTMPTLERYSERLSSPPQMSCPWNRICPSVGISSRLTQRSSVLLPEPEEPMMLITSPFSTERSMPRSTSCSPKVFLSPLISITDMRRSPPLRSRRRPPRAARSDPRRP